MQSVGIQRDSSYKYNAGMYLYDLVLCFLINVFYPAKFSTLLRIYLFNNSALPLGSVMRCSTQSLCGITAL